MVAWSYFKHTVKVLLRPEEQGVFNFRPKKNGKALSREGVCKFQFETPKSKGQIFNEKAYQSF